MRERSLEVGPVVVCGAVVQLAHGGGEKPDTRACRYFVLYKDYERCASDGTGSSEAGCFVAHEISVAVSNKNMRSNHTFRQSNSPDVAAGNVVW